MAQQDETPAVGKIFAAIIAVKEEINRVGVEKARENTAQGFSYRGIDDALNGFSGPFARNNILPTLVYETVVRDTIQTKNSTMLRTVVSLVCTFLSLEDGSTLTVGPFEGEAVDTLDKATTKATSVAFRNLLFMTFTVPFGAEEPEQYEGGEVVAGDQAPAVKNEEAPTIKLGITAMTKLEAIMAEHGKDKQWVLDNFGSVTRENVVECADYIRMPRLEN